MGYTQCSKYPRSPINDRCLGYRWWAKWERPRSDSTILPQRCEILACCRPIQPFCSQRRVDKFRPFLRCKQRRCVSSIRFRRSFPVYSPIHSQSKYGSMGTKNSFAFIRLRPPLLVKWYDPLNLPCHLLSAQDGFNFNKKNHRYRL